MDYQKVEDLAMRCLLESGTYTMPVDCMALLDHYGLKPVNAASVKESNPELYRLCCKYSKDGFIYRPDKLIIYQDHHAQRTRFTLMHELGHYILATKENEPYADAEAEANYFAACILAHPVLVSILPHPDIDSISTCFNISKQAAARTLTDYTYWLHRQYSASCQVPPVFKLDILPF